MRAKTFTKFGIGLVVASLAACTVAMPAQADPASSTFGTLVGVGSDTTQDVMNGISAAIGGTNGVRIASYDATGGQKITTRNGGTEIFRPNGSGNGRDVLRVAIGNLTTVSATVNTVPYIWNGSDTSGQVDFARSSGGPTTAVANGVVTYVPFGVDAVDYATSSNSVIPQLSIGSSADAISNGVGTASLWSIYNGRVTKVVTATNGGAYLKVVDNSYVAAAGETLTPIHAYVPQAGSGTRSFWITKVGITEPQITAQTVPVSATTPGGVAVQENDGTALAGDAGAIVPFSIGQWVSQANALPGVTDRRNGAVLGQLEGQAPTVGSGSSFELNPAFTAITRKVFNIVPSALADDGDSKINWAFVGTGSLVCSQEDVIKRYGFGLLTATSGPNACGDTSLRAYAPATSSIVVSGAATVKYGSAVTVTATVTSNNDGGGSVTFYNGEKELSTVKVAAGKTTAALTVKPTSISDLNITADFTPALTGVDQASSTALPVDVQAATSKVTATAASVKASKAPVVKVTVTATGVTPTGKVTIKEGTKTLKSNVTLSAGKATVTLPKLKAGTHKLVVSYLGSTTVAAGKSATVTLKVTK